MSEGWNELRRRPKQALVANVQNTLRLPVLMLITLNPESSPYNRSTSRPKCYRYIHIYIYIYLFVCLFMYLVYL